MAVASNNDYLNVQHIGTTTHHVDDPMALLAQLQLVVAALVESKPAYVICPLGNFEFMQVMSLEDGSLRLESSASPAVLAANLGFTELVEDYEHVAGALIPADWGGQELMVAETMMRLAIDVHKMQFPAEVQFRLSVLT